MSVSFENSSGLDMEWRKYAACVDADPEMFFPDHEDLTGIAAAKAICERCIVLPQCLEEYERFEPEGIWAGLDPKPPIKLPEDALRDQFIDIAQNLVTLRSLPIAHERMLAISPPKVKELTIKVDESLDSDDAGDIATQTDIAVEILSKHWQNVSAKERRHVVAKNMSTLVTLPPQLIDGSLDYKKWFESIGYTCDTTALVLLARLGEPIADDMNIEALRQYSLDLVSNMPINGKTALTASKVRQALIMQYGLDGSAPKIKSKVAADMGLSENYVSTIISDVFKQYESQHDFDIQKSA